jgi:hypothetical protein
MPASTARWSSAELFSPADLGRTASPFLSVPPGTGSWPGSTNTTGEHLALRMMSPLESEQALAPGDTASGATAGHDQVGQAPHALAHKDEQLWLASI